MDGRKTVFSQFPAYITRFKAASRNNYATLFPSRDNKFKAAFFALSACRQTYYAIREMTFIDGTHTFSRFKMILLIAVAIDTDGHTFPLAYVVVPIKNEHWWTSFLDQLAIAYHE
jgi:hypothetical protein